MKLIIRLSVLMLCILLASCRSKKEVVSTTTTVSDNTTIGVPSSQSNKQSAEANRQEETSVTAKIRLELSSGGRSASLGGMLRMKRDNVIQLSLVTFGVLEVARIEMTPDYFMVIDKMGRQYVKASYNEVSFLRRADVDFRTLQTYFWDEQTSNYAGWERSDFVSLGQRSLPTKHNITIPNGSKTIKAALKLSNLRVDSNWETRTQVPARYTQVPVDELLTRIMKLTL